MARAPTVAVLFVCTGNICRSPTADGVFRKLVADAGWAARIRTDSAGTIGYHVGAPPDRRACRYAALRGYDLSALRARQVESGDFERFDLVLAMDGDNHDALAAICPPARRGRLRMFREFATPPSRGSVPDPYYGGDDGFERVLDLVESGCRGLLTTLQEQLEVGSETRDRRREDRR